MTERTPTALRQGGIAALSIEGGQAGKKKKKRHRHGAVRRVHGGWCPSTHRWMIRHSPRGRKKKKKKVIYARDKKQWYLNVYVTIYIDRYHFSREKKGIFFFHCSFSLSFSLDALLDRNHPRSSELCQMSKFNHDM